MEQELLAGQALQRITAQSAASARHLLPSNLDATAAALAWGELAPEKDDAAYRHAWSGAKQVQTQRVGERTIEKGLVLVNTGQGKGKPPSTGFTLRTWPWRPVAVVQFIKGAWPWEAKALQSFETAFIGVLVKASPGKPRTANDRQLVAEAAL